MQALHVSTKVPVERVMITTSVTVPTHHLEDGTASEVGSTT